MIMVALSWAQRSESCRPVSLSCWGSTLGWTRPLLGSMTPDFIIRYSYWLIPTESPNNVFKYKVYRSCLCLSLCYLRSMKQLIYKWSCWGFTFGWTRPLLGSIISDFIARYCIVLNNYLDFRMRIEENVF